MRRLVTLFSSLLLCLSAQRALAVNASPHAIEVKQPDGTVINVRPRGDEFYHWFEDTRGFAVLRENGRFVYARPGHDGGLQPTQLLVGRDNPEANGLQQGLRPNAQFVGSRKAQMLADSAGVEATPSRIAAVGTVRNLVILCRFSDHTLGVHTRATEDYDTLMNAVGGHPVLAPTGSLKDYFTQVSYGTLTFNSTVIAWVTLPQTEEYYGAGLDGGGFYPRNAQRMVEDALNAVDSLVDFGQFDSDRDGRIDSIDIIHSGYGAETGGGNGNWIWSHRWNLRQAWVSGDRNADGESVTVFDYHTEPALWGVSGTEISRIGVLAHETGHFFGLPDLYDTDYTSAGIGAWCLMADSWGFDGTQLYPPHPSAWAKTKLGWVTPVDIAPGTYSAPQVQTSPTVYRITNGYAPREYLLIENRQRVGYEIGMPASGLAIWHIDDNKDGNDEEGYPGQAGWPANNRHFQVALLQADGRYDLERTVFIGADAGDLYRAGGVSAIGPTTVPNTDRYAGGIVQRTGNMISGISVSASNMTFTYSLPVTNAPLITGTAVLAVETCTPTNGVVDPNETVTIRVTLRNAGQMDISNIVATLQASSDVLSPSTPQNYGSLPVGGSLSRHFTYTAGGSCGGTITNTIVVQAFGTNLVTLRFPFVLGATAIRLSQNFDAVPLPSLPANWINSASNTLGWITAPWVFISASNSAFAANPDVVSDASLISPPFLFTSSNAVLSFAHRYDTELGFDGGVLEISVENGPWRDILDAGGYFIENGYNKEIDLGFGSPIAGRRAWTGGSGTTFLTTTANLPPAAAFRPVRLRWRLATDFAVGARGWNVDAIQITERNCCNSPVAPMLLSSVRQGNNIVFSFASNPGQTYHIEYKDTLNAVNWLRLSTNIGDGSTKWVTNTLGAPRRFYRLKTP